MLSLRHSKLATEEERLWNLAIGYGSYAEQTILAQCRAREDFEARERAVKKKLADLTFF